ncbi:MAG: sulfatase [Opitutaceae bacterium]|nr:sulfatase [Opitutaceae bacterium]
MFTRNRLLVFFSILGISQLFGQERPNIVFIFSDDHAYQAVSAYGSVLNETPNIDRLATEGMLFDRCYVTNSICGPQRATIQTGKYSHKNGFLRNGNHFDGNQKTFPKLLQKAGYQTAVIGKWHLGEHMPPKGYDYSEVLIGQGPYYNPPMLKDENGDGKQERIQHTGYTSDIISDLTLAWLKNGREPNKPFMLMTQHKAPHRNWQPGPKYLTKYDDQVMPEPATLFEDYNIRLKAHRDQAMQIDRDLNANDLKLVSPTNLTPEQLKTWTNAYRYKNNRFLDSRLTGVPEIRWKYQRYIKDYLRSIDSVDEAVGEILDYLDGSGLADNTIVIYTSDQGFYLGEHGWFDKRWIYEESLKTPFIVRWPGTVKMGSKNEDIVSPIDFAATFLEIAGHSVPEDWDGRSILPILKGDTPNDWRKFLYYHYYEYPGWHLVRRHYGIVDGRYKLIHFYEDDVDEWELIDLVADPLEQKNFFHDPKYELIVHSLGRELERLRMQLDVPDEDPKASFMQGDTPERYLGLLR